MLQREREVSACHACPGMQPFQYRCIFQAMLPLALERLDHGFLKKIMRREGSGRRDDLHVWSVYVPATAHFDGSKRHSTGDYKFQLSTMQGVYRATSIDSGCVDGYVAP